MENLDFFITFPFKRNEDINLAKASRIEMSPEHLQLATKELAQLQIEGFIEAITFQWAYQAFYVN